MWWRSAIRRPGRWSKVRNLLFVKPSTAPARPTNMQVVTLRKDGQQRIYQFDLECRSRILAGVRHQLRLSR